MNPKDFLLEAIKDSQNTIRAVDTKGSIIFGFEAVVFGVVVSKLTDSAIICPIQRIELIAFLIVSLISIYFIILAIFPFDNPSEYVREGDKVPKNIFYISGLAPKPRFFHWWRPRLCQKFKVEKSINDVQKSLNTFSKENYQTELSYELLKLSFIRTAKINRIKISLWFFLASLFLTMCLLWVL